MARPAYIEIGHGTFGIIFQDAQNEQRVVKRTLRPHVDPRRWLAQDAKWHDCIFSSFAKLSFELHLDLPHVPRFLGLEQFRDHEEYSWLNAAQDREDRQYRALETVLQAQRIPPVSDYIKEMVVDQFIYNTASLRCESDETIVSKSVRKATINSALNQNCLLRVYFGRNPRATDERPQARKLTSMTRNMRNFSMDRARLSACLSPEHRNTLLNMLANAMACLHWYCECDGKDVEFVLGGLQERPGLSSDIQVFGSNASVWLLDFNQVEQISMDRGGVRKAAEAFIRNDPYFPKFGRDFDDANRFQVAYLVASHKIMVHKMNVEGYAVDNKDEYLRLPSLFICTAERLFAEQRKKHESFRIADLVNE